MTTGEGSRLLLAVCLCCCLALCASGQVLTSWQRERVQRLAREVMSCGRIPGMSLSAVRGSDSWTLPLGVANMTSGAPIRNETTFAIGSLTKAFTSTLLVSLLAQSPRNWTADTPLATILGKPDLFADSARSQQATVKDVLSHRLGLARADLALFAGYPAGFSLSDVVSGLSCLPQHKPFRDGYVYSNLLYSLAGHVVEQLTNQSYSQALTSHLLAPLGMTSTGPYHPKRSADGSETRPSNDGDGQGETTMSAVPYVVVRDELLPADPDLFSGLDPFLPALGLASTGPDMVRWLQVQLSRGVSPSSGERVLSRGVVRATHEPVTPHIVNNLRPRFPAPDLTFAYGLGWQQAVYKGFRRAWHSGSLFGFVSQAWLFPDLDLGLFVAVNGPARSPDTQNRLTALLYYVTDLMLGDRPWIDGDSACSYPRPLKTSQPGLQPSKYNSQRSREVNQIGEHEPQAHRQPFAESLSRDLLMTSSNQATASLSSSIFSPPTSSSSSSSSSLLSPSSYSSSSSAAAVASPERQVGSTSADVSLSLSSLLSSRVASRLPPLSHKPSGRRNITTVAAGPPPADYESTPLPVSLCAGNPQLLATNLMRYTGIFHNKLFGKVSVTMAIGLARNRTEVLGSNSSPDDRDILKNRFEANIGQKTGDPFISLDKNVGDKPCKINILSDDWQNFDSNLRIRFGERFSGNLYYGSRDQKSFDTLTKSVRLFKMVPTGIFEFSAYSPTNEIVTLPLEFSNFDGHGTPHLLRAVWQPDEVLEFGRGETSDQCVPTFEERQARNKTKVTMSYNNYSLVPILCLFHAIYFVFFDFYIPSIS